MLSPRNIHFAEGYVPSSSSTAPPPMLTFPPDGNPATVRASGGRTELFTIASSSGSASPYNPAHSTLLLREKLFLTSWAKYRRFGRFPTGFSLNLALMLIITCQLCVYYNQDVRHASSVLNHFFRRIIGVEGRFESRTILLDTPTALKEHVARTLENGIRINDNSIRNYTIQRSWAVKFSYRNGTITGRMLPTMDVANALPEIFNRTWLPDISEFDLSIEYTDAFAASTWTWGLTQVCDGAGGGNFVCSLDYVITDLSPPGYFLWTSHLFVFSLAVLSVFGIVRKAKRTYSIYVKLEQQSDTWNMLKVREKISIVNLWWVFTVITNITEIIVALQSTLAHENVTHRLTGTGISIFLSYINIIQYFEHYGAFHLLFCTLLRAVPEVAKFVICVMPIVCAFAFLGVLVWWPISWFSTPSMAFCTLFSLLNGDVLHDNFLNLRDVHPVFSQVYLYLFLCFFICVVLNVNITIIGESFLRAQQYDDCRKEVAVRQSRLRSELCQNTPLASNWRSSLSLFTNTYDRRGFTRFAPAVLRALDEIDPIATSFTESDDEDWPAPTHRITDTESTMNVRLPRTVEISHPRDISAMRQRAAEQLSNKMLFLSDIAPLLAELIEIERRNRS